MKKIVTLLGLMLILSISLFSQNTYYIKGNAKILNPKYALILKEDRNEYDPYYEVKIRIKDSVHTFTALEVKEYKHSNSGKVYVSERLPESGKEVFMELIEDGYLRLYFIIDKQFRRRFFIKKGEQLMELTGEAKSRSNFQRVLRKHWDECKKTRKLIKIAKFNRPSLKRTIRAHNTCKEVYIPRVKLNASAGVAFVKPEFNYGVEVESLADEVVYRNFIYNYKLTYIVSAGISIPISQTDFSFETGLRAQGMSYNYSAIFSLSRPFDRVFNADISVIDLAIPLDVQYTIPNIKYRPFFRLGLSPNFFMSNKVEIEERLVAFNGGGDEIILADEQLKTVGIGINLAAGFQQQLTEENEVFITLGYHRRGATPMQRIYTFSTFYCMIGFGF